MSQKRAVMNFTDGDAHGGARRLLYRCSACGAICFVGDPSAGDPYVQPNTESAQASSAVAVRRCDGAVCMKRDTIVSDSGCIRGDVRLVRMDAEHIERQFRLLCPDCKLPVAYTLAPMPMREDPASRIIFVLPGAISFPQTK